MLGSPWLVALVFVIVWFAAIVQVGLGMGFGLTAAPLLALLNPDLVPAPALVLGMLTASWGAYREREAIVWNEVLTGIFGRITGVAIGAFVLAAMTDGKTFMLVFGLMIGLAVILSVGGWKFAFSRLRLVGVSTLSGFMGTITSVGAPPMALIYQHRPPATARPTLAAFFALGCLFSLTGLAMAGRFGWHDLALAGWMLPPMLAGILSARYLGGRFDRRYRPALLAISGTAAVVLIIRGLA
jgi:uncharacterized membrane protein YfcA